jgi:hypothetical protein
METQAEALSVYRELADSYEQRGDIPMRDRFLMLAADTAVNAGQGDEAERLRDRLLRTNRNHMLRAYASFEDARFAPDVQAYIRDLRTNYPLPTASRLLQSLKTGTPFSPVNSAPQDVPTAAFNWAQVTNANAPATIDPTPVPVPTPAPQPARQVPRAAPAAPSVPPNRPAPRVAPANVPVPRPATQPRPSQPAPRPAPVAAPAEDPPVLPLNAPEAPSPAGARAIKPHAEKEERPAASGGWLGATLAVLLGAVGVAWVAFTLARPFVPPEWLE